MNWVKVFREYNLKQLKSSLLLHICVVISVLLAVATAISIPRVTNSIASSYQKKAVKINGADVTIQTSGENFKLCEYLNSKGKGIKSYTVGKAQNGSIKRSQKGSKAFYTDVISVADSRTNTGEGADERVNESTDEKKNIVTVSGFDNLKENEIIISSYLAEKLNLSKNDTIKLLDKKKKIVDIEDLPYGASSQGKQLGYVKANIELTNPYAYIYYINLDNPDKADKFLSKLKSELKNDMSQDTTYSTAKSVVKENNKKQENSLVIVSLANTTCFIFTLFTTLSCGYMLLSKRKKDHAIMQLNGIRKKIIRNALFFEFLFPILIGCVLGGIFSTTLEKLLLAINGLGTIKSQNVFAPLTMVGVVFFFAVYVVYVRILTLSIIKSNPYYVIKEIPEKRTIPLVRYVVFTLITFFVYAIYVGTDSVFVSSIILIFVLLVCLLVCFVLVKLICAFKNISKTTLYVFKKLSKRAVAYALVMLAFVFMNVFMMLGYNLPKELSNSYNSQLKKDLPFNYIAMVKMSDKDDQASLEKQIEHFSKIRIRNGIMCKSEKNKLKTDVTVGWVKNTEYYYKYSIKKGQQIDKLKKNEIVISDVFAEKNKLKLNDTLDLTLNLGENVQGNGSKNRQAIIKVKVAGIYVCQNINPNLILCNERNISSASDVQDTMTMSSDYYQYLLKRKSVSSIKNVENTLFIGVNNIVDAMLGLLDGYVNMLKILGFICIFVALIFSINVFMIFTKNDEKEQIIVRAIGMKKKFLQQSCILEVAIQVVITFLLSFGMYTTIESLLSMTLFKQVGKVSIDNALIILCSTLCITFSTFAIKMRFINRHSNDFMRLKEDA